MKRFSINLHPTDSDLSLIIFREVGWVWVKVDSILSGFISGHKFLRLPQSHNLIAQSKF